MLTYAIGTSSACAVTSAMLPQSKVKRNCEKVKLIIYVYAILDKMKLQIDITHMNVLLYSLRANIEKDVQMM